jgi:glycerol kinase
MSRAAVDPAARVVILALDQGTTSSRAIVFDRRGAVLGSAQQEFRQHFPQPGWVEHDARGIWATQSGSCTRRSPSAGVAARDVAAIGITNQRETTMRVGARAPAARCTAPSSGRTGAPRRCATRCATRRAGDARCQDRPRARRLFLRHQDRAGSSTTSRRARTAERGELAFGTVDSLARLALTGGKVHAPTRRNAARTLLFDIHTATGTTSCCSSSTFRARCCRGGRLVRASRRDEPIDLARIPIAGIAGDQQAALFGQACFAPGCQEHLRHRLLLLLNTGAHRRRVANHLLTHRRLAPCGSARLRARGQSCSSPAPSCSGCATGCRLIRSAADVEALAASVADNGGVYFVPAFTGLGAPHWDAYARGAMFGLDARIECGAHRTRGAGGDRVPERRRARCDADGCRHHALRASRRRRRCGERPA